MGRKGRGKSGGTGGSSKPRATSSTIDKMENYEDTLEKGGVDEFMFKRDQINFDDADQSDDDDINGEQGEEVFALKMPKMARDDSDDDEGEDDADDDEMEDDDLPVAKGRKEKKKLDLTGKGRFGKPIESSDDEDEEGDSGSGSSDEEEGWGRQYYSKPSNRREKEVEGEYDEKREEDREMEEREVRRLQRKAREAFSGVEDWGLEEVPMMQIESEKKQEDVARPVVAAPETTDAAVLLRHLELYEPVKIALARDFPLVVHKLRKTAKGIEDIMKEEEGQESLHKGLGWLHYQTLITYATTLAFYIHLCALPPDSRPDMATHPILTRLLQLKEGVAMLEDLDFAAGESSDVDPLEDGERTEEDEELAHLMKNSKAGIMMQQIAATKGGAGVMAGAQEGDEEEEDDDEQGWYDEEEDMQGLWHTAGLEDGELDDLLADVGAEDAEEEAKMDKRSTSKKEKRTKEGKKEKKEKKEKEEKKEKKEKREKKDKKAKTKAVEVDSDDATMDEEDDESSAHHFAPLEEPAFFSASKKSKSKDRQTASDDILGDPTALNEADATDKERRKRSLQFHTSKIASTSARRAAARAQRLGGDEDIPHRDRQAARDAALRKHSQGGVGEDLDGSEWTEKDKKRAREVRDEDGDDADGDDGDDYYDLVKRRKTDKLEAKEAAHDEFRAAKFASFEDDSHEGGPRALTRAIEKNRGLTPRRAKTGRNPRVKKRQAYEKAKQKVGSQRAVFKGGQAALGGSYSGEKTGISQVTKSRKF